MTIDMPSEPTLSDGTAGGIEAGAITFALCQELIDDVVLVSEEQIAAAMRQYMDSEHQLIEGAAGVAIAAMLRNKEKIAGRNAVVLICGANISRDTLKSAL